MKKARRMTGFFHSERWLKRSPAKAKTSRKSALFPLTLGRAALCCRLRASPFSKLKRSKKAPPYWRGFLCLQERAVIPKSMFCDCREFFLCVPGGRESVGKPWGSRSALLFRVRVFGRGKWGRGGKGEPLFQKGVPLPPAHTTESSVRRSRGYKYAAQASGGARSPA